MAGGEMWKQVPKSVFSSFFFFSLLSLSGISQKVCSNRRKMFVCEVFVGHNHLVRTTGQQQVSTQLKRGFYT